MRPIRRPAILVSCLALAAGRAHAQCPDGTPPPCRSAARAAAPIPPNAIAVLYFDNLSRDTADTYLADGFTEEVMSRLSQIERLQVKSRTAVQRLRGRPLDDPAAVGRSLGVAHLVSGSVLRQGGRVRVTVELTRVATGNSVWGKSYDRPAGDLIQTEAEIAESVAVNVGTRVAPAERRLIAARQTQNPVAYDAWLRARFEISRRTLPAFQNAIRWYQAAIRADSSMQAAWIGLALAYGALGAGYYDPSLETPRESLVAMGRRAAERALRIDSNSVDALYARAGIEDPVRVVQFYSRIIELRPRDAAAHHSYALSLRVLGRDSLAIEEFRRAIELEPDRAISLLNLGQTLMMRRRFREARRWVDSAAALRPEPSFYYTEQVMLDLVLGDTAAARTAAAEVARTGSDRDREVVMAMIDARAGDSASARRHALRADSLLGQRECWVSHDCLETAAALAQAGLRERALAILDRIQPRDAWLAFWINMPALDPLQGEPRYQAILAEARAAAARR